MLFRQLFEPVSCTYTYLVADKVGGEGLLLDPVDTEVDKYVRLLDELELNLVFAVDTHVHADHVTAIGPLADARGCAAVMGDHSKAESLDRKVADGERIKIGQDLEIEVLYTPGHTDDSYSFLLPDRVLTGDTLLIRGTGRTDFQHGDARAQYDSIFHRLLKLDGETMVFPGHDYKGWTVSTIDEERKHNPRLQVDNEAAYVEIMAALNLARPAKMDIAVPANLKCGRRS